MAKKSKGVSRAIRRMYGNMAKAAAERAVDRIGWGKFEDADVSADWAEGWYEKAGAHAARDHTIPED